jgi:hypothetical protein
LVSAAMSGKKPGDVGTVTVAGTDVVVVVKVVVVVTVSVNVVAEGVTLMVSRVVVVTSRYLVVVMGTRNVVGTCSLVLPVGVATKVKCVEQLVAVLETSWTVVDEEMADRSDEDTADEEMVDRSDEEMTVTLEEEVTSVV